MSAASRRKGVAGEREVADKFRAADFTVRGLEGQGDWLAMRRIDYPGNGHYITLHLEIKRQERVRLPEWLEQARAEAPPDVPPVVVFRQSRGQWIAALPLDDLLELIG